MARVSPATKYGRPSVSTYKGKSKVNIINQQLPK